MDAIVLTHFIDMPNLTTAALSNAFYYVSEKIVSSMRPSSRVTCRCRCVGSQQVPTVILVILFVEKSTHGKVKFGSLMGALKLVRTSSKLAHFDA